MNKTCVNHPGATDHSTTECPWNTEKGHGLERGATAQKIDCMCAGGLAGAAPPALERIRDQLKCSLNMGGLKDSAHWAVGELDRLIAGTSLPVEKISASLPVGVPDALREAVEYLDDNPLNEIGAGSILHRAMRDALAAAPTVKAEQVDDRAECIADGLSVGMSQEEAEEFADKIAIPSRPAAGSAVEEVEVVAWRKPDQVDRIISAEVKEFNESFGKEYRSACTEPLMTVAQHERIVAALSDELQTERARADAAVGDANDAERALSAQQSAHVSVPRGLLEELVAHIEDNTCTHDNTHRGGAIWEICDDCGEKWADDRGGKPAFKWPDCVEKARALLNGGEA